MAKPTVPPTIMPPAITIAPITYGTARPAKRVPPPACSSDGLVVGSGVVMGQGSARGAHRSSVLRRASAAGKYGGRCRARTLACALARDEGRHHGTAPTPRPRPRGRRRGPARRLPHAREAAGHRRRLLDRERRRP